MREITLADLDAELAIAANPPEAADDTPVPEALIVILIPRGSPFEHYARAIAPGIAASHGRAQAVRIDTTAEPEAPARFGLSGSPGLAIFIDGKQMAAFAVPFAEWIGAGGGAGPGAGASPLGGMLEGFIQRAIEGFVKMLPPGGREEKGE